MMMFSSNNDDPQKSFYVHNVLSTYELWKSGEVPFEWAGFVHYNSRNEFDHYYKDDINKYLPPQLIEDLLSYEYDITHGGLYQILMKKFLKK